MTTIAQNSNQKHKVHRRLKKSWRFIGWLILFILGLVALRHVLFYYTDLTLPLHSVYNVKSTFSVSEQQITRKLRKSETPFFIKGVHIDPVSGDGKVDQYLQLLAYAGELNANTVVVDDLMEPAFYEAFQSYNSVSGQHLYLLQGIRLSDETYAGMQDAYDGGLLSLLVQRGKLAIDAVHGARRTAGYYYKTDVSVDTLGYLVGQDWDSDLVLYTDYLYNDIAKQTTGLFVRAYDTAGAFDKLLAGVFDRLFAYETRKYGEQRLIGLANGQRTDPLFHDTSWSPGLNENLAHVNAEVLSAQGLVESGIFAAYHVDTAIVQTLSYDPTYSNTVDPQGQSNPYYAYLAALKQYHVNLPVVLSSVSVSSARGVSGIDAVTQINRGGLNETEQANALLLCCQSAVDAGFSGVCIDSLVDNPLLRAWNSDGINEYDGTWLNAQDSEQSLGLLALESGAEESTCIVDGKDSEWTDVPVVLSGDGFSLQLLSDEKYLNLLIKIPSYDMERDVVYIPFDITPESGTKVFETQNLTFDRYADFVLTINGSRRARLYVQEYYDRLLAYRGLDVFNKLSLSDPPMSDSGIFNTVRQLARKQLAEEVGEIAEDAVVVEAGLLRYGTADPAAEAFDSLADYCIGTDCIEVRIPWALLNFRNPAQGLIEGDLFAPDRKSISIDAIYVSMIVSKDNTLTTLSSQLYSLEKWTEGEFYLRKKAAYEAIADWFS